MELIASATEAVRAVLPPSWGVEVRLEPRRDVGGRAIEADAELTLRDPSGSSATVLVESKRQILPKDVARVAAQVAAFQGGDARGAVLVAPFVSPTVRAELERHGMGWFDPTGNLRLAVERPAVFIDRVGANRSALRDPEERLLKTLRGAAAARVVLALCESRTPVGVREVATLAGVSASSSSRVLDLLDREATIRRGADGAVVAVRKRALVTRWAADYQVMKSNEVIAAIDPRGIDHALKALPDVDVPAVLTGSAAARAYLPAGVTPVSPLVSLSVYTADPIGLMDRLRLKRVERGANVFVIRPYDDVVAERARTVNGRRCAPPAQVVADLLTGSGRSTEEAEQLMGVLAAAEEGWAA
ncbi:type IV toxin-antitoxin system AbiEi family antitoxin [Saccharothrix sp.]|uniref:type IV toxin-antitoxin system AbiEi family antitoxin n=1 Tax=Saccharothrix sp. TaxID=1873460 RepID=UPI0028111F69|nr:type IV toxin-antitoxin system AbiEi family antitoxin [Saccharothrix sp.]